MLYAFGEYDLDTGSRTLHRAGKRIAVQDKAFEVLAYLIEHRDDYVSSEELLDALWPGISVSPAALSQAVRKARQAVGDDGGQQRVLRTKHGHGFRFVAEIVAGSTPVSTLPAPGRSRARLAVAAGGVALLLAITAAWLMRRPLRESAPARSVAVLPFANLSQDAAAEPFTDGIYDDILTQISRIRDLKVIARTTMERLDPSLSIQQIGMKLGVAAVLEGGVQRAGDRIRINVQLNDCETETHLWAETYDRELTAPNVFAIQSEIAASVADALRAELSPEEQGTLAIVPTESLAAYQAYLLGRQRLSRFTNAATEDAVGHFQNAIALDPNYAPAYVGLADAYVRQARWSSAPVAEMLAKAQDMVEKARELDSGLGEAHASLALIKQLRGDFAGAEAGYRRALELNPNYATAYEWYGILLRTWLDRIDEALSMFLRAAELDPLSARILAEAARSLEFQGRFDEALAWYERAFEVDPLQDMVTGWMGDYHWSVLGELDQAVVWFERAASLDRDYSEFPARLGAAFLELGDSGKAEYWIERSIEINPRNRNGMVALAFLHLYRADEASALNQARRTLAVYPRDWRSLDLVRSHELSRGRYAEARALYEKAYPALLGDDDPTVGRMNFGPAVDLALVLFNTGEKERADLLLEKSLRYVRAKPRFGMGGYGLTDVEIFALQGEKNQALSTLRQAMDEGWRRSWWYSFEYEPNLASLRGDPEFQVMREEIRADMAAQLERVREMERRGELELGAEQDSAEVLPSAAMSADSQ